MSFSTIRFGLVATLVVAANASWAERVLLPGDRVEVRCSELSALCVDRTLDQSGSILLPGLAPTFLAKLSKQEAAEKLTLAVLESGLAADPHVSLRLLPTLSKTVTVLGLVGHPGPVFVPEGATLQDVLIEAAPTNSADLTHVTVTTVEGESLTVDAKGRPWAVHPGDRIELATVAQSPQVFVVGGVQKPGVVPFISGMSAEEAIRAAGGMGAHGAATGWRIRHAGEDATDIAAAGDLLRAGDTLEIPLVESRDFAAVTGGVIHSGSLPIREGMRLTELLQAAGGLAKDADLAHIEVKSVGERRARVFDFQALMNGKQIDPVVKKGDAVTVRRLRVKGRA